MPPPNVDLWEYFHTYAYKQGDIDLFIYGLTPQEANKKVNTLETFTPHTLTRAYAITPHARLTLIPYAHTPFHQWALFTIIFFCSY